MIRYLGLILLLVVIASCNKQTSLMNTVDPGTNSKLISYKASIDSLRKVRVEALKQPQGWLSLIGLHWLKEGVNTLTN